MFIERKRITYIDVDFFYLQYSNKKILVLILRML